MRRRRNHLLHDLHYGMLLQIRFVLNRKHRRSNPPVELPLRAGDFPPPDYYLYDFFYEFQGRETIPACFLY